MKRNVFCFIVVLSVVLGACGRKDSDARDGWENYHEITGTPLTGDSLFLGRPGSIVCFDGHLGVYDFYDGKIFTWIDLEDKTSRHNTRLGNGPGEFIPPLYLYKDGKTENVRIFERSKGICYTYKLADALNGTLSSPLRRDSVGSPGNQVVPCGDYYVGNQMSDDKKMFYLLSSDRKTQLRFGFYPGDLKGTDDADVLDMMTQCQMAANNEGDVVVAAGYMTDMLSFYKIENGEVSLLKEYFSKDADVDVQKDATGIHVVPTHNTLQTYIHLCPTRSFLYALYWGTKENERKELSHIQVFDWKGNFIKGYSVKKRLISIAVDETEDKLYGLTAEEESPILVYSL